MVRKEVRCERDAGPKGKQPTRSAAKRERLMLGIFPRQRRWGPSHVDVAKLHSGCSGQLFWAIQTLQGAEPVQLIPVRG